MKAIVYQLKPAGWAISKACADLAKNCFRSIGGLAMAETPQPGLPGPDWVLMHAAGGNLRDGPGDHRQEAAAQFDPPGVQFLADGAGPRKCGRGGGRGHRGGPELGRAAGLRRADALVRAPRDYAALPLLPGRAVRRVRELRRRRRGQVQAAAGTSIGYNSRTGGSLGQFFVAHVSQLVPLDDRISDELAVLTDPLACSLHAVLRADLFSASRILIYGSGVLGLGVVAVLRAVGYAGSIDALDRAVYLGDLAKRLGANDFVRLGRKDADRFAEIGRRTGGAVHRVRMGNFMLAGGYDIVFDCVGSRQSIEECLKWTTARGQMIMVGTGHGGGVDLTPIWFRELHVVGAYGRQIEEFQGRKIGTYQLGARTDSRRQAQRPRDAHQHLPHRAVPPRVRNRVMERQTQGHQGGPRFPDGRGDQDMRKNDRRAIVQQVAAKSSTKSIFQQVAGKLKEQRIVQRSVGQLPQGYQEFLRDIKSRIQAARTKACLAVNRELILLIGRSAIAFWPNKERKDGAQRL